MSRNKRKLDLYRKTPTRITNVIVLKVTQNPTNRNLTEILELIEKQLETLSGSSEHLQYFHAAGMLTVTGSGAWLE